MKSLGIKAKISFIVLAFNLFLLLSLTYFINKSTNNTVLENMSKRLEHIAATAKEGISKKTHSKLYKSFRKNGVKAAESESFLKMKSFLKRVKDSNKLASDVYTAFIPSWAPEKLIFLGMSAEEHYLGNTIDVTDIVKKVYETKMVQKSKIYSTEQGEWISGVAPIINSKDKVVGIIQVDLRSDIELAMAKEKALQETIIPIMVISLISSLILFLVINFLIKGLSKNIDKNVDELSNSSRSIFDSCHATTQFSVEINKMNEEHLKNLETTSASLDEINAMSKKASNNTNTAVSTANQAITKANTGKETINKMLGSISQIAQMNDRVSDRMNKIKDEISHIVSVISKISDKTSIINDIVFQTKLLSFNASVEAARAGEHGKGFAVLASEIANLASVSGDSSQEITDILQTGIKTVEDIISSTDKDIKDLVQETSSNIKEAVSVGADCENAMTDIFDNVNTVINMMNEIHSATKEQTLGIEHANESIHNLNNHSQKYKDVSNTSKEIAKNLQNQLQNLQKVVYFLEVTTKGNQGQKDAPNPIDCSVA